MKTILSLLAFLYFPAAIFCQDFLEAGNQWVFEYRDGIWGGPPLSRSIETMTVGGDTLVNGQTYKIINITQGDPCGKWSLREYLREEEEKIYRLSSDMGSELLMIDFSEEESYELQFEAGLNTFTGVALVQSFGEEFDMQGLPVETQYLKIENNLSFDDDPLYRVYENVGFVFESGLLFPEVGTGLCDPFKGSFLQCHIAGGDTLKFSHGDCFELDVLDHTVELNRDDVAVGPNPFRNSVSISVSKGIRIREIVVADVNGSAVYSSDEPIESSTQIHLEDLPSGMYLLRLKISGKDEYQVKKIFKN